MNTMQETRAWLESIGQPGGDLYSLPTSEKRFDDGCQYRFEIPGIQGPSVMKTLLEELDRVGFYIHRVTQTKGIWFLTDEDITAMVELAAKHQVELVLAIGPRATTDTSASVKSPEGVRMGYRLRGQDQVVRALEDVRRAARLGVRTFLVYDEGCLWALGKARETGLLPEDVRFKMSAHAGHGNPCSAKLLESIGADSFNIVRDYQLQHLAAVRATIDIIFKVFDCFIIATKSDRRYFRLILRTSCSVSVGHPLDTLQVSAHDGKSHDMSHRRTARVIINIKSYRITALKVWQANCLSFIGSVYTYIDLGEDSSRNGFLYILIETVAEHIALYEQYISRGSCLAVILVACPIPHRHAGDLGDLIILLGYVPVLIDVYRLLSGV